MYDLIRNRDSRIGQHKKAIEKSIVTYVGMSGVNIDIKLKRKSTVVTEFKGYR